MKKLSLLVVLVLFSMMFNSCWDEDPIEELHLTGTKWKLVGFYDVEKQQLTEAEPKNCEQCYTLYFGENGIISGQTVMNTFTFYSISAKPEDCIMTAIGDAHIGNVILFYEALETLILTSCVIEKNMLKIYYNSNKNYLFYKRIE